MKKYMALAIALACILAMFGCQKANVNSDIYLFPEPIAQFAGTAYSNAREDPFEADAQALTEWFYGLELSACDEPEAVEGSIYYSFNANGEEAFGYEDRGSVAYVIVEASYYEVGNPAKPPVNYLYDR